MRGYLENHLPSLVILENVPSVTAHGEGEYMSQKLWQLGYIHRRNPGARPHLELF